MMEHDGMDGFFGMGVGWLWFLLVLIIVILVIWLVIRNNQSLRRNNNEPKRENAREILERRFANGEISSEEYRERKDELNR